MTYWHIQLHPTGKEDSIDTGKIIKETNLIGLGDWKKGKFQREQFKNDMKIGDIVVVRNGIKVFALVEVIGEIEYIGEDDNKRVDWFNNRREVKILEYNENKAPFPSSRGTLKKSIDKKTPTYQYIDNWYTKTLQKGYNKDKLIEETYKIKELYIKDNEKIFQDFKIDFTSDGKTPLPIIVIAGKNGTGKTTLLDYLANFEIEKDDYIEIFKVRKAVDMELELWDESDDELIVDNFKIIDGMKGIQATKKEYSEHVEYLSVDIKKIENIKKFIYNRYKKRIRELPFKEVIKEIAEFIENIFNGMELSFKLIDIDDTQTDADDKVKVNITFQNKNGKEFDIDNLSTGEKTLLSKVLYLYFRDVKNQIILIDEPELSLHPAWQNRVLKLYENFAKENNCQIIIATHSPHIIGSAKNEWIRILTEDGVVDKDVYAHGRDINSILFDVMGEVRYRPLKEFDEKIDYLYYYIDEQEFDKAKEILKELEKDYGKNDKVILEAKMTIDMLTHQD